MPNSGAVGIEPTSEVPKTPALTITLRPYVLLSSSIFLVTLASVIRTPALLFPFQTEPSEESEIQTTSTMSATDFCKAFQFLAFRFVHIKPPLSQRPRQTHPPQQPHSTFSFTSCSISKKKGLRGSGSCSMRTVHAPLSTWSFHSSSNHTDPPLHKQ